MHIPIAGRTSTLIAFVASIPMLACAKESAPPPEAVAREELVVDSTTGEQLYRNNVFHFRIKFPPKWQVKNGDGAHVRKKAVNKGATILVLVKDVVTPELIARARNEIGASASSRSDEDIATELRSQLDSHSLSLQDYPDPMEGLAKFTSPEVVEYEMRSLDNRPASFSRTRVGYTVGDVTVRAESITYTMFVSGLLFQVQAAAPVDQIASLRKTIDRSLLSFVMETW